MSCATQRPSTLPVSRSVALYASTSARRVEPRKRASACLSARAAMESSVGLSGARPRASIAVVSMKLP